MTEWQTTSCVLCAQNCGLQVKVENNRIVKVKGDKTNPRSQGYICRKGVNIANYQHHKERLTHPLKKTGKGFVKISWNQAFSEIGEKLRTVVDAHGPKSFAFMGGGGQGCHFEAAFGTSLMKGLGSKYHYTALAQELTGYFWDTGRMFGRQNRFAIPDERHADMILGIGWNGMASHQMPQAPLVIKEFARNPDKLIAIIDPRRSETAREANIHIPLRPGTDALLARAMIAIILQEGWENQNFITQNTSGFDQIRRWFDDFDIQGALEVCEVNYDTIKDLCKELSRRKWCMHFDLGVYMNRHSTLATYLYMLLSAVCGRYCVPGGNIIPGSVVPIGKHSYEHNPKIWRTQTTNFPEIIGMFPPNVMPEEILSDHPERLRAVVVSSSNPLRSYADTTAYERAFKKLDLLVTIEVAMTETAELSDYVLPSRSAYESYDGTFFTWNFPEIYFQMRHPVLEPAPDTKEAGQILSGIAHAAGVIPEIPDYLYVAAQKNRQNYAMAFFSYIKSNPKAIKIMPLILEKTLGQIVGSGNLAALWGIFLSSPSSFRKNSARAGHTIPSLLQSTLDPIKLAKVFSGIIKYSSIAPIGLLTPQVAHAEKLYEAVLANPQGLWIGKMDANNNMDELRTEDMKINLYITEMEDWIAKITPEDESRALTPNSNFPFVLNAGRHTPQNANSLMRNPDWNKGRRACTLAMNPADAKTMDLFDGETVRIITEASSEEIELEVSDEIRKGQVLIPHGFGLKYQGKVYGVNVNRLTEAAHRDRLAATPLHRYVPCRVEKI